jgi:hypothetical protein
MTRQMRTRGDSQFIHPQIHLMQNTTQVTQSAVDEKPWRGIFFRGPTKARTYDKKEVTNWSVFRGDNLGRPKGKVYQFTDFARAAKLAEAMSRDRGIDLIREASELAA